MRPRPITISTSLLLLHTFLAGCGGELAPAVDDPGVAAADGKDDRFGVRSIRSPLHPDIPPGRRTHDIDRAGSGSTGWLTAPDAAHAALGAHAVSATGNAGVHTHGLDLVADAAGTVAMRLNGAESVPALARVSTSCAGNGSTGADVTVTLGGQVVLDQHPRQAGGVSLRWVKSQPFEYRSSVPLSLADTGAPAHTTGALTLSASGNANATVEAIAGNYSAAAGVHLHLAASGQAGASTVFEDERRAGRPYLGPTAHSQLGLVDDQLDVTSSVDLRMMDPFSWQTCWSTGVRNVLRDTFRTQLAFVDFPGPHIPLLSWIGLARAGDLLRDGACAPLLEG